MKPTITNSDYLNTISLEHFHNTVLEDMIVNMHDQIKKIYKDIDMVVDELARRKKERMGL